MTSDDLIATNHLDAGSRFSLGDFLFPAPARRDAKSIFKWWEKRRLGFNLIVGASGILTLGLATVVETIMGNPPTPMLIVPVLVYAGLANVCYTLGAPIEITIEKLWGGQVVPTGPTVFRMGLTFAVGLTFVLPTILIVFGFVIRVLGIIF